MCSQKKITKGRKSIGRQRIEIKQLEEESKKQVTFSKRRAGMFKKAAELCILCGAEIAVIAYSTHGNVFCFGHPDVETVVNRYLTGNTCQSSKSLINVVLPVDDFNRQHAEAEKELEMEKKRLKEIEKVENNISGGFWWDQPLDENMGLEEMEEYLRALQEVRRKVAARVEEFRMTRNSLLQAPVDMAAAGLGNYVGLGNDFVVQDWEGGSGSSTGFVGSHGFGFGFGHGQI